MLNYLISGVGRSGTTALYDSLSNSLRKRGIAPFLCYEPLLWGPPTWNMSTKEQSRSGVFRNTSSLHALGIWAHTSTALFSETTDAPFVTLLESVARKGDAVLAKVIRASGRLEAILDWDPRVKIVHICRNPVQVVNSTLQLFSFFGEEFHESDEARFVAEVGKRWNEHLHAEGEDIAVRQAQWWYYMNKAAFEAAERHPNSVVLVSQEALLKDRERTLNRILTSWGLDVSNEVGSVKIGFGASVGGKVALSKPQLDNLRPFYERYGKEFLSRTCTGDLHVWKEQQTAIFNHFRENAADECTARWPGIDANMGHFALRNQVLAEREQHRKAMDGMIHRQAAMAERFAGRLSSFHQMSQQVADEAVSIGRSRLLKLLGPAGRRLRRGADKVAAASAKLRQTANVTCVVTCHNNKSTIRRAVTSVIGQTLPVSEIIIADDQSTDGSNEIIADIAREYDNVRIVRREQNVGPGLNRHLAFLEAGSSFVTQLDGDDTIGPDKIEREWSVLQERRDRIVYSDYLLDMADGSILADTFWFTKNRTAKERVDAVLFRTSWLPHNMLYSKALYVEVGGYDTSARMYEDWSLKLRLAAICDDWRHTAGIGLIYNRHNFGLSSAPTAIHDFWIVYCLAKNYRRLVKMLGADRILEYLAERLAKASWYPERDDLIATLKRLQSVAAFDDRLFAVLSISLSHKVPEELHEVKEFMDRLKEHATDH